MALTSLPQVLDPHCAAGLCVPGAGWQQQAGLMEGETVGNLGGGWQGMIETENVRGFGKSHP